MSRIIKFRGRNITTGEWVYGCLVNNLWTYSEHHSLQGQSVAEIIVTGEADDWSVVGDDLVVTIDPKTMGQFTGLIDRNKKEIYEGDIVGVEYGKGKVIFHAGCFMIEWIDDPEANMELLAMRNAKFGHVREDLEMLGNIYQNPELLKKEEQP